MAETHLNKHRKYFHFQSRIRVGAIAETTDDQLWNAALGAISELVGECGIEVCGLVLDRRRIHIVFSTPYFNENILILDWEIRIRKYLLIRFDRPISCEPVNDEVELKNCLLSIYKGQMNFGHNSIVWQNPFSSLKLFLEGSAQARLFKDPLKIVFSPSKILQLSSQTKSPLCVENQAIDRVP